jgi:hypothetical protein
MRKLVLVVGLLGLGLNVNAQKLLRERDLISGDDRMKYSGMELVTYTKHHNTGLLLMVGGSLTSTAGIMIRNNGEEYQKPSSSLLIVSGSIISLIGLGFILEAPIHIKNAGLILRGKGAGIVIKF